jgi:hypothetical protein
LKDDYAPGTVVKVDLILAEDGATVHNLPEVSSIFWFSLHQIFRYYEDTKGI